MTASGTVYVEDIATQIASYDQIKVYRGTSPTGAFTALATTLTLVAAQEQYAFTDASATSSTLWRCSYYNSGTTAESSLGPVIRPGGQGAPSITLASFRKDCARLARAGSASTCSGTGTTTTLVDATLAMSGVDAYYQEGNWIYRPNAGTATDVLRRIGEAGFAPTTGTLTIPAAYPWAVAPASAEAYELYGLYPPIETAGASCSWNDAIRDGIRDVWYRDQVNLGEGGAINQTRFSLQQFGDMITRDSVLGVLYRTTDSNGVIHDQIVGTSGSYWNVQENDTDGLTLIVSDAPTTSDTIIVNIKRRFALPYIDTDLIPGPISLATAATLRNLFLKLDPKGARFMEWQAKYRAEYRIYGCLPTVLV